jgi:hypothetical protein
MSAVVELKIDEFLGDDVYGNLDPDASPKASESRKSAPSSPDRVSNPHNTHPQQSGYISSKRPSAKYEK